MTQENNTLFAEGNRVLYIEKVNLITKQYTYGSVMLPIGGELQTITTTPEDVIECFLVTVDGVEYKIQADSYDELVTALIRIKYDLDAELALVANMREDPTTHQIEEKEFQAWRKYCKKLAKQLINE